MVHNFTQSIKQDNEILNIFFCVIYTNWCELRPKRAILVRRGVSCWVLGAILGWSLLYFNAPCGRGQEITKPFFLNTHTYPPYSVLQGPFFLTSPFSWTLRIQKSNLLAILRILLTLLFKGTFLSFPEDRINFSHGLSVEAQMCGKVEDKSPKRIKISVALCSTGCWFGDENDLRPFSHTGAAPLDPSFPCLFVAVI